MTAIAVDYARAIAYLDRARLPAYVSFIERASARGIGRDDEGPHRVYVRISDGAIVSGAPPESAQAIHTDNGGSDNPFHQHGIFDPRCYVAHSEDETRWNGQPAIRFRLQPTCKDDSGITELYTDPQTFRPIAVDGDLADSDSNVRIAIELRYATIGQYTLPSVIRAHAVGHGWLFWARERAEVDYTDYQFYQTAELVRRQASKP